MNDRTFSLAVGMAGATVALVSTMVPSATDAYGQPDFHVQRGYVGALGAVVGLGGVASYLDRTLTPLAVGLVTLAVLVGCHNYVQKNGAGGFR